MRNRAVDTEHRTGVEVSSHPCPKDYFTSSKGLFLYFITTHVLLSIICAINILPVLLTLLSSALDRDSKHAFILGPASLVANKHWVIARRYKASVHHTSTVFDSVKSSTAKICLTTI